nr:PF20097 family protein [uncultured Oscillibacter sp.]
MECPYCGKPMEAGYLSSRSPVFWSENVSGLALPTQGSDVLLGKMLGLMRPRAWLCRDCGKVITDYKKKAY